MPRLAYSIASDLVAAFSPPLLSEASTEGTLRVGLIDQGGRDLDDVAGPLLLHLGDGELRDVEEAGNVGAHHRRIVLGGVLRERLCDEDAGIVDQRVDTAKAGDGLRNHALGRLPVGDVAGNGEHVIVARRLDGTCGGDDAIIAIAKTLDQGGADALRCTGDDGNLLLDTHDGLLLLIRASTGWLGC